MLNTKGCGFYYIMPLLDYKNVYINLHWNIMIDSCERKQNERKKNNIL